MNALVKFLETHGHRGWGRAIKREDLAGWLSVSVRAVKHMAEDARLAGIPLLYSTDATAGGLYLAETDREIEDGIDKLTRLAVSILRERRALKRALKEQRSKVEQRELFG